MAALDEVGCGCQADGAGPHHHGGQGGGVRVRDDSPFYFDIRRS
ncbi:hypothetical protein [Streptomyces yanii]|uniref:Uncharacterized protein n=1 Tax=Streptomyces yanii TaxID=78510 RepID=A0ABV5RLY2_9ACTN